MDTINPEQLAALPLFDRNRMAIPTAEWQRYIGQWVALNSDGTQIVAGAANVGLLIDKLREMRVNLEEVTLEGVEEPDVA